MEKGWARSSGWHPLLPPKTGLLVTVWPDAWVTGPPSPHPTPCLGLSDTSRPLLKLFPLPE